MSWILWEEIKEQGKICIVKKDNLEEKTLVEKMKENLKEEESLDKTNESEDDSDDDYEVITYRKKEYWLEKGEEPQNVYEIIGDDELGKKVPI